MTQLNDPVLEWRNVSAGYDGADVLRDVSLRVDSGDVVAILGRNGVGKSTLVNAVFDLGPRVSGDIRVKGQSVCGWATHRIARLGLGLVPQGRGVFAPLSVHESLSLALLSGHGKRKQDRGEVWTLDRAYEVFPRLHERRKIANGALSGCERQMLALARALLTQADVLVLDEPSEGLSPKAVDDLLVTHLPRLAQTGMTLVLVEQNISLCLRVAQRAVVLAHGSVVFDGSMPALAADRALQHRLLGV